MKQLIISDKVQKEMLTDFMIMRETKGLNEQKDRKADKKKRFYLSIFAFIMLLFVPVFVYASEMKSDGKNNSGNRGRK